jgi:hypothetical protein
VWDVVKAGDGTGEVSSGRRYRTSVTAGISRKAKSCGIPDEKSEEAIVLMMGETTKLTWRKGSLLQPSSARK